MVTVSEEEEGWISRKFPSCRAWPVLTREGSWRLSRTPNRVSEHKHTTSYHSISYRIIDVTHVLPSRGLWTQPVVTLLCASAAGGCDS
jgi:hypothetical protein